MDIFAIASRIAASGYDFRTKMRINALVLEEIAREAGLDLTEMNDVATGISESDIHGLIQQLANTVHEEAERLKSTQAHAASILEKLYYELRTAAKKKPAKKPKKTKGPRSMMTQEPEFSCRVEIDLVADFEGHTTKAALLRKLKREIQASLEAGMKTTARDLHISLNDVTVRPVHLDCAVDAGTSPDEED
jgi:hypothetical protein